MSTGLTIAYFIDETHYRSGECQVSRCTIVGIDICTTRSTSYQCYDGMFSFTTPPSADTKPYTLSFAFEYTHPRSSELYSACITNSSVTCAWDDRNIRDTLVVKDALHSAAMEISALICGIAALIIHLYAGYSCHQERKNLYHPRVDSTEEIMVELDS